MTHHIVTSVRSLAVYGAVRLGLRHARVIVQDPQPRRSEADLDDLADSWMFDHPKAALSSEAYLLDQEYGRVSGALSGLRAVLSNLMKMPLEPEETYRPVAAASMPLDSALFDEIAAPVPVLTNVVAFDDDDLFIESSLTLQKHSGSMESLTRVA
jgi:hypothetical protein